MHLCSLESAKTALSSQRHACMPDIKTKATEIIITINNNV